MYLSECRCTFSSNILRISEGTFFPDTEKSRIFLQFFRNPHHESTVLLECLRTRHYRQKSVLSVKRQIRHIFQIFKLFVSFWPALLSRGAASGFLDLTNVSRKVLSEVRPGHRFLDRGVFWKKTRFVQTPCRGKLQFLSNWTLFQLKKFRLLIRGMQFLLNAAWSNPNTQIKV